MQIMGNCCQPTPSKLYDKTIDTTPPLVYQGTRLPCRVVRVVAQDDDRHHGALLRRPHGRLRPGPEAVLPGRPPAGT